MGKVQVVVGGQYGSEGKGAVCGYLGRPAELGDGMAIRVAGPNAGHTVYGPHGDKWALRQVPVAAVVNPNATLAIAAGSEIDPQVLRHEVGLLEEAGYNVRSRLMIDRAATIIEPHHLDMEAGAKLTERIGSTGKGIGAARSSRIMRRASTANDWDWDLDDCGRLVESVAMVARRIVHSGRTIQIEGTQGYGLGLHTPHYPQVTSSDCRAIDFLAMAGISPWWSLGGIELEVFVVFRPYPIRVAGNSGPMHGETTWEALGLPAEKTTVTKKIRRVGAWDGELAYAAIRANGGPGPRVRAAITMLDHVASEIAGVTDSKELYESDQATDWIEQFESDLSTEVDLVGTSPSTMVDLR